MESTTFVVLTQSKVMLSFQLTKDEFDTVKIERKTHSRAKIRIRMDALYFTHLGYPRGEAAVLAGCSPNSLTNYIKRFNQGGLEAIRHWGYKFERHELRHKFDRVRKYLTEKQVRHVRHAAHLLKKKFAYQRGKEAVRQLLHRLGFRRLKVGVFPGKPKELQVWLAAQKQFRKHLKKLRKRAKKGEIDLGFSDAAHFVYGKFDAYVWTRQACYAPSGHGRYRINVYSTYDAVTRTISSMYNEGYVDADFMFDYLSWLRQTRYPDEQRALHLVMDNARYQHCAMIKQKARELNIVLEFLPAYSPNLNLVERLWKYLKGELAHQYCATKEEFEQQVVSLLNELGQKKHRKKLKSLLTFKFQKYKKSQILSG